MAGLRYSVDRAVSISIWDDVQKKIGDAYLLF